MQLLKEPIAKDLYVISSLRLKMFSSLGQQDYFDIKLVLSNVFAYQSRCFTTENWLRFQENNGPDNFSPD